MKIHYQKAIQFLSLLAKKLKLQSFSKEDAAFVGGVVRDALLLKFSEKLDIDIVTSEVSFSKIAELLSSFSFSSVEFKSEDRLMRTSRFFLKKEFFKDIEIWIRQNVNPNYRLEDLQVDLSIEDNIPDKTKRDFTVNSIYFNTSIFFPSGMNPIADLKEQLLIPAFEETFRQDPVRILRAVRFIAKLNLEVVNKLKFSPTMLSTVAKERITEELVKIFSTPNLKKALIFSFQHNIWSYFAEEFEKIKSMWQNKYHAFTVSYHSIKTVELIDKYLHFSHLHKLKKEWLLRLAAFFHDIGKANTKNGEKFYGHDIKGEQIFKLKIAPKLRLAKDDEKYLAFLIKKHMYPVYNLTTQKQIARFWNKFKDHGLDLLALHMADFEAKGTDTEEELAERRTLIWEFLKIYCYLRHEDRFSPLLNGNEIMKILNIPPSPTVGKVKNELIKLQLEGKLKTKEEAIKWLEVNRNLLTSN